MKGNQSTLQTDVEDFFKSMNEPNFVKRYGITKSEMTVEKAHGRIEKRQIFLCCSLNWLKCRNDWANLKAIGMTIASRTIVDETTVERQYFISSLTDVEQCKKAFRNHWGIESNHWILDVLFKEDDSRINRQNRPQNLAVVRKLALNLLKRYKQSTGVKKTLTKLQIDCLVNPDFLKTILTYL